MKSPILNHVSTYVGKTCYVVHRLDKETSGALVFAKNPFVLPVLNRLLEDKKIQRDYWALILGSLPKRSWFIRTNWDEIATIDANALLILERASMRKPM